MNRTTCVMGILNVTPDSFYDGGRYHDPGLALERAVRMVDEGADWIDVGGESSRPGAAGVTEAEERGRVVPVVRALSAAGLSCRISVDTRRAAVAEAALAAGAHGVNDISALSDPDMAGVVAHAGATVFLMHMRGSPATMQEAPRYDDVLAEVLDFLAHRIAAAREAGVSQERIWVDPGIGFGKDDSHNAALLRGVRALGSLGCPVLVGVSRKSFIGRTLGLTDPADRLEGSLALAALCAWLGASMIRAHDVRATRRAVDVIAAVRPDAWT